MPRVKSDIRLINGDVASTFDVAEEYLSASGFKIFHRDIQATHADIKASNTQRNVLKLYLSNSPQIVHWHIEQQSDGRVQIEIAGDLFIKFRVFFYACLVSLLITFGCFCVYKHNPLFPLSVPTVGMASSLLLAFIFLSRIANTFPYEKFVNQFYKILSQKGITNIATLQTGFGFPDILKGFYLFILLILVPILFLFKGLPDFSNLEPILFFGIGALIAIVVFIVLIFLMVFRPATAIRVTFVLIGFVLCIPIIMHSNMPLELSSARDIIDLFEMSGQIEDMQKYQNQIPAFYLFGLVSILLLAGTIFIFILQIPVRIIKDANNFFSQHPRSFYTQALQPGNSFSFNLITWLLWAIMTVAIVFGLYFGFSVSERTIFDDNFLFKSELAKLFFENTKMVFMYFLQPHFGANVVLLLHKLAMLMYALPVTIIFLIVIVKNIISTGKDYALLKNKTDDLFKAENRLSKKIKAICKFANIRMPIIRIVDFPYFDVKTKYLGFPTFNSVLIISKGVLEEIGAIDAEIEAVLAHEIGHIKKHTFIRKVFCFLSDYTLFGNGFLAVLQNSYLMEKEADDFAVRWLIAKYHDKNKAKDALTSLLEKLGKINSGDYVFKPFNTLNFAMLKNDTYRDRLWERYLNSTLKGKLGINLKLLYQLYFGEEILSYFHPPESLRKAWIKEK